MAYVTINGVAMTDEAMIDETIERQATARPDDAPPANGRTGYERGAKPPTTRRL